MSFNNNKKEAIFIIPSFSDFYISRDRLYPNNAVAVCKILENLNISTKIVDFRFGFHKKSDIPKSISYLKDFYKKDYSNFSLFNKYNYFGLVDSSFHIEFFEEYKKKFEDPDIILISSNFTAYRGDAINVIESAIKYYQNRSFIIIGGNDVIINSAWYKSRIQDIGNKLKLKLDNIILYNDFDLDRFENIIKNLYEKDEVNKKNCGSFQKREIRINEKIIEYYFLEKVFFYNVKESKIKEINPKNLYKVGSILFSYGCPFRCSYCFYSIEKFKRFYYRKIEDIYKDLLALYTEGFDKIHIEDDSFTANKDEAIKILNEIITFKNNFDKFTFDFPNGLNYHKIDNELIEYFEKANILSISIALGSLDEKILTKENRPSKNIEFSNFINLVKNFNIDVQTYIIAGFVGQSFEEILISLFFLFENNLKIGFSPYYPVINSKDYLKYDFENQLYEKGFDEKYFASSSLFGFIGSINVTEKATLFKIYRILSFLSNEKKINKDWISKIYNDYLYFITKSKLCTSGKLIDIDTQFNINNIKNNKSFEIFVFNDALSSLEAFIFILFLKTLNIYIVNEKKKKEDFVLLKFEKFPSSGKIEIFYKMIEKIFNKN